MNTAEIEEYRQFTSPGELHKAINMLHGLLDGMKATVKYQNLKWLNSHTGAKSMPTYAIGTHFPS